MSRVRFAQVVATQVSVLCPYCGEPQPDPENGSDLWVPEQVQQNEGERDCVACDVKMRVHPQTKAQVI